MTATDIRTDALEGLAAASDSDRGDRLEERAATLRPRTALPIDRWFQLAGGILLCLGVLAIIAGWYGVSHTARAWRQTPYLVSGGLLGLGLIFIGGFSYFAFWMTKLVEQVHHQTAVLERIEVALVGDVRTTTEESGPLVVAAGVVHRPDCPLLAGKTDVHRLSGDEQGLSLCPMCEPELPRPPSTSSSGRSRRGRRS